MGRPQTPLDRDGSPVREFAFWLRDLRSQAGLTYSQLARTSHYSTSTLQEAAGGHRFPTLRVVQAFVLACRGDITDWEAYWAQIKRLTDGSAPADLSRSVDPPWVAKARAEQDRVATPLSGSAEGWYLRSLVARMRLDTDPVEAIEHRVVVATVDGISELATSVSVPRHPADSARGHGLDVELLDGGTLERREQPYESLFTNVVSLRRPLRAGESHEYVLRLRLPPGQPMVSRYVHQPLQRSDSLDLRVQFRLDQLPGRIWKLTGVPPAVANERDPRTEQLKPDAFGEVHVTFSDLRQGLTYGLSWQA